MRKLLQNKAVVGALSVIAVASVAANFVKLPGTRVRAINARAPMPDGPPAGEGQYHIHGPAFNALAAQPWRELYPIDSDARDPFAPAVLPAPVTIPVPRRDDPASPPEFRLQATSVEDRRVFAVINQSVVGEGDVIEGYRVEKIIPGQVRLSGSHGTVTLGFARTASYEKAATASRPNADLPAANGGPPSGRSKP